MAQYSFIKSTGGVLISATPDTRAFINSKVKPGAVLYADFRQARNPAFHRKFFALLNLGFDYWQPGGGAIFSADEKLLRGYVQLVAHHAGHEKTLLQLAEHYLREQAGIRARNSSLVKSFDAFRAFPTPQAAENAAAQLLDYAA